MNGLELICFQMISNSGMARTLLMEAVGEAKNGQFAIAESKILESDRLFLEAHHAHAKILQEEASGNKTEINLLLLHAEDQMMSVESFKIIILELIDIYKKIKNIQLTNAVE